VTLTHVYSGKVRDVYAVGDDAFLFVASDRISAFDVVLAEPVPDKGRVLTALSAWWFDHTADLVANHMISADPTDFPPGAGPELAGRTMLVRRAEMLPIECIVRAYLSGSAWKEYRAQGTVHGIELPAGLQESDRLPEPLMTPSTKAPSGEHDENISPAQAAELVGDDPYRRLEEVCLAVFARATERATAAGLVLADTKFELGLVGGELVLADEVLTPDSSRWWEAAAWAPGTTPSSYDKQPVRDWLEATGWDKKPPAPALPGEIVAATRQRYVDAYERLTGLALRDWPGGER
jgi:phosphoribosylaminoimidazole-succinocarboxamide synthase